MIYIKRIDTCFLFIPKTGSQSLHSFVEDNIVNYSEDVIGRPIFKKADNDHTDFFITKPAPHNFIGKIDTRHVTAQFVVNLKICTSTTKFIGVIRNPYERPISLLAYQLRNTCSSHNYLLDLEHIEAFRQTIRNGVVENKKEIHSRSQVDFFKYNGELLPNVEFWLLEDLEQHLNQFCKTHQIDIKKPVLHVNKTLGNKLKLVDVLYTDELKEKFYEAYKEDFEIYNKLKEQL
jgi:hypothetical protein